MTGCDGTNNPYPVSSAIAENAEAHYSNSCHDSSGPGSACNPLEGEIWSTDQTRCVHDPALPVCPTGKVLATVNSNNVEGGFHCKDE